MVSGEKYLLHVVANSSGCRRRVGGRFGMRRVNSGSMRDGDMLGRLFQGGGDSQQPQSNLSSVGEGDKEVVLSLHDRAQFKSLLLLFCCEPTAHSHAANL